MNRKITTTLKFILLASFVLVDTAITSLAQHPYCYPATPPFEQCFIGRKYEYLYCFGGQFFRECTEFPNDQPYPLNQPVKYNLDKDLCVFFNEVYPPAVQREINEAGGVWMTQEDDPTKLIQVFWPYQEPSYARNAIEDWLCLCPSTGSTEFTCCVNLRYSVDSFDFDFQPVPGTTELFVDAETCEVDPCATTIYINVSDEFTNYDHDCCPNAPFEVFYYIGDVPPKVGIDPSTESAYNVISLRDLIRHEVGHLFGLGHHESCGEQGPNYRVNSGVMSGTVQFNAPPRTITQDDACAYKRLYCPNFITSAGKTEIKPDISPDPQVYPNPVGAAAVLVLSDYYSGGVDLFNAQGVLVKEIAVEPWDVDSEAGSVSLEVDTSGLTAGVYFAGYTTSNNQRQFVKFIVGL